MKLNKLVTKGLIAAAIVGATLAVGVVKHASAACVPYDPNSSISTPVFNNFCNVPEGIGNEPDFVRIRPDVNGNNEDNQNNPDYTGGTLNSACDSGNQYDVWTYVHNNAASGFNNNGAGTSVAHNVLLTLTASKLNQTGNVFPFSSTVTASNAASVQDSTTLSCNGQPVKLTLVPSTVHVYSAQYGWHNLGDNSVNSTFKIGSPVLDSGDQWGCWDYRVVVVYTVKVEKQQTPPQLVCSLTNYQVDGRTVKLTITPKNLDQGDTVVAYEINWGDGNVSKKQSDSHTYTGNGPFNIVAKFEVKHSSGYTEWVSGGDCNKTISFTTPPVTPPQTPPTTLVNTGAGDVFGIFTATSVAGAFLHRKWSAAKAARQ